jgi:hypothetical protein
MCHNRAAILYFITHAVDMFHEMRQKKTDNFEVWTVTVKEEREFKVM